MRSKRRVATRRCLRALRDANRTPCRDYWRCANGGSPRQKTANGSGLARAIDYSLKRWSALIRYADSGRLPIDNNLVENAIRPITLGRRNWLFTGSERAGRRAAAIQSLLATAKLNGLEPYAWLKETLEKCRPGLTAGSMNSCRFGLQQQNTKSAIWRPWTLLISGRNELQTAAHTGGSGRAGCGTRVG